MESIGNHYQKLLNSLEDNEDMTMKLKDDKDMTMNYNKLENHYIEMEDNYMHQDKIENSSENTNNIHLTKAVFNKIQDLYPTTQFGKVEHSKYIDGFINHEKENVIGSLTWSKTKYPKPNITGNNKLKKVVITEPDVYSETLIMANLNENATDKYGSALNVDDKIVIQTKIGEAASSMHKGVITALNIKVAYKTIIVTKSHPTLSHLLEEGQTSIKVKTKRYYWQAQVQIVVEGAEEPVNVTTSRLHNIIACS